MDKHSCFFIFFNFKKVYINNTHHEVKVYSVYRNIELFMLASILNL
ncbi:hypothetical protein FORC31_p010 (plasmid) [Escherichia coli]|nr:hypothetical protein FORC31_p010 [Escherichia coli]EMZ72180.1 hypothetical protein EC2846750_1536 [Escherichia coli 2846750]END95427.1 hypothetical protein ECP03019043_1683 [Escherichia coli P0301904.3]